MVGVIFNFAVFFVHGYLGRNFGAEVDNNCHNLVKVMFWYHRPPYNGFTIYILLGHGCSSALLRVVVYCLSMVHGVQKVSIQ
jgi:hypothetical protein